MTKFTKFKFSLPALFMLPFAAVIFLGFLDNYMLAWADDAPVLGASFIALFDAIKNKAAAAVVIMHVFQILRTHEVFGLLGKIGLQGKGLQIAIAVITALGFVAEAYGKGANLGQALIEGLFTAGGSMLIYDAVKANAAAVAISVAPLDFSAKKE